MIAIKKTTLYSWLWPKLSYGKQKLKMLKSKNSTHLREIMAQIQAQEFSTERAKINYIRNWVKSNSIHLIDDEHDQYAFNLPLVLSRLNDYSKGLGELPHLSCGPRAYAMKEILDGLNIENRIIDLFGFSGETVYRVSPHTLIEVFEADQQSWVLQDPDFNVAYTDKNTGEYLCVKALLQSETKNLTFDAAGFAIENPINLRNTVRGLFEYCALYRMSYVGKKSMLLVNAKKNMLNVSVVGAESEELLFSEYIYSRDYKYSLEYIA